MFSRVFWGFLRVYWGFLGFIGVSKPSWYLFGDEKAQGSLFYRITWNVHRGTGVLTHCQITKKNKQTIRVLPNYRWFRLWFVSS